MITKKAKAQCQIARLPAELCEAAANRLGFQIFHPDLQKDKQSDRCCNDQTRVSLRAKNASA